MGFAARYSEVSSLVAELHSVSEDRLTALRGRLQHLQKLRFPPGTNTGRGRPAEYLPGQLVLLLVAVELMALGIPPERAVRALQARKAVISAAIIRALGSIEGRSPPLFITVRPAALFDEDPGLGYASLPELDQTLKTATYLQGFSRIGLVNLSSIIFNAAEWAARKGGDTRSDFLSDLSIWASKLQE